MRGLSAQHHLLDLAQLLLAEVHLVADEEGWRAERAAGVALTPMLLAIFAILAIELPSAVILSRTIGLAGVWAAYPIVFCAMFGLQMGYYFLVWRKRAIRRLI